MAVQAKERKTARELEDMIAGRLGIGGTFIKVHADPAYGWHATVMTAPAQAVRAQQTVEEIAKELRALYDLKKEYRRKRPLPRLPLRIRSIATAGSDLCERCCSQRRSSVRHMRSVTPMLRPEPWRRTTRPPGHTRRANPPAESESL
jgi:hypothetical protein